MNAKADHLLNQFDLTLPEMAGVLGAADRAAALLSYLEKGAQGKGRVRGRFRFEHERKGEMVAFLNEHYEGWTRHDIAMADRLAALTIKEAQQPRALWQVPAMGKAWWATRDPRYGAAFDRFFTSVETGEMFNWAEFNGTQAAIELDAYFMFQDCPSFTPAGRIAFLDHLVAIAENAWDRHTSRWDQRMLGPEGHNWYLHGMHVLPFVGLLFPELKRASFFLRTGWSVVEEHLRGHYRPDGGARETCLGYSVGSLHDLWDHYGLARRNGHPVSPGFETRLLNATRFLLDLMTPQAGIPTYGDGGHSVGGLMHLAAVATAHSGDGACKWFAEYCRPLVPAACSRTQGQIPLEAFWATGLAGAATYAATRVRAPGLASSLKGSTGYAAMRDSDRIDANYLAIAAADRGPIVTSHGHNDIYSLEVQAAGTRFIGDLGCAGYGVSPARDYDQLTRAHTCVVVNGREQTPLINEWRWSANTIPVIRRWISEPTHDFFHAVHEGYYRWDQEQTLHARKVVFLKASAAARGYFLVFDWLDTNREANDYQAYFHACVPGSIVDNAVLLRASTGQGLAIIPPAGEDLSLQRVNEPGLTAYLGEKSLNPELYPAFVYSKRSGNDCLVWALVPLKPGEALPRVERLPVTLNDQAETVFGATAVRVTSAQGVDTLCVSHKDFDADLAFGGIKAWGHLSIRRADATGRVTLSVDSAMDEGVTGR